MGDIIKKQMNISTNGKTGHFYSKRGMKKYAKRRVAKYVNRIRSNFCKQMRNRYGITNEDALVLFWNEFEYILRCRTESHKE